MKHYQCFACEKTSQFDGELLVCPHCGKRCLQEYDPTKIKPIEKPVEKPVELFSDIVDKFASDETKSKLIELSIKLAAINDKNSVEYTTILEKVKTLAETDVDARRPTNKPTYKPVRIVYTYPDVNFAPILVIMLILFISFYFIINMSSGAAAIVTYIFYVVAGILCLTVSLIVAYCAYMYVRKRRNAHCSNSEMERKAIDIPKYPGA